MNETHIQKIATRLSVQPQQVLATALLLEEGSTIPFIARYRKERTGQLDEVQITDIRDALTKLAEIDTRRAAIIKSLSERDLLTDDLSTSLLAAETLSALEDIYLPHRPKRRTRATIAREKGLEPLAQLLFDPATEDVPETAAMSYIDAEKGVADMEEALAGARDIIAEWINEDTAARKEMRTYFTEEASFDCKVRKDAEEKGAKFRDYFDWSQPSKDEPGHRLLAMFRGEKEEVLSIHVRPAEDQAIGRLKRRFVPSNSPSAEQVSLAAEDAYRRLMATSMEVETRMALRERADEEAIGVFASNLRELLMTSPLGQKAVLALDPAYRTGCKTVCLDRQGKLLFNTALFITRSEREAKEAGEIVVKLCEKFKIEAIAIGNGTASRETEAFVRALPLPKSITVVMVNESGASVYSASTVAREEFPDQDLTVRGAVSIGRRLMDPLSELVKIDPKAIGVGQYQHDVDQRNLKHALDDVVISCVNNVGVELNTASQQLLSYVSGLNSTLAKNIISHRNENGPFTSRASLKKVARLGPKAFEQAAGFLRIRGARNPLDASAVHPESYKIVDQMAKDLGCKVKDLMADAALREKIVLENYITEDVGLPTLRDIVTELAKPGRDPREKFETFAFDEKVHSIQDLKAGMKLPGIVTNVTKFGAFVDVGAHQDGLVHISELADRFVEDPADVVKVNQKVQVTVMEVDLERNRVALSMKAVPGEGRQARTTTSKPRHKPSGGGRRSFGPQGFGGSNPFADAFGS